jgi:hypothetical protein
MENAPQAIKGLPENAYRELKSGEVFIPVIPADKNLPQVTKYSFLRPPLFWD